MPGVMRVKPLALACAVMMTLTLLLTWNRLYLASPQPQELIQQDAPEYDDSEVDPPSWTTQLYENEFFLQQQSTYSPFLFDRQENVFQPATAIVSRVDENENGLLAVIKHLSKYPFIKEILIYNQLNKPLVETFPEHIQVINANLQSMGKFTACAVASHDKCYFQDDLWLNPYMDSLYTHSLRYPQLIISNTRQSNYVDYSTWRFTRPDIDLHTGFTDLRYGAFVPKEMVSSFVDQLNSHDLNSTRMKQADVYFSMWNNQYPYLVVNSLLSSGRDTFKGIDTVNNRQLVRSVMYDALGVLEKSLLQRSHLKKEEEDVKSSDFERNLHSPPVADRDVRTSCINDKCLFITNIDPLPLKEGFDTSQFNNISEYEAIHGQHKESLKATLMHDSFHKAVDQDTETCWNTVKAPKSGDYFGLYLVGDIQAKRVVLYVKTRPTIPLEDMFKVSVQYVMYGSWEQCTIKALPVRQTGYRLDLDFHCANHQPIKSIRIEFLEDQKDNFELCGLGLDNFAV